MLGQEKYGSVTASFYRDVYGLIILFDLSKQDAIKNVPRWIEEAGRYKVEKIVVVGNKKDLGSWISEVFIWI